MGMRVLHTTSHLSLRIKSQPCFLTLLHASDNGGKVVIQQDHVSRLLRDVGASDAHGNANVCLLQRGGVVHTIPRHGNNGSLGVK